VVWNWSTKAQALGGASVVAAGVFDWVVAHLTHGRAWRAGRAVVASSLACMLVGLALMIVVVEREPWREVLGAVYVAVAFVAVVHGAQWLRRRG
jgi:hypothetical protein